MALILNIETATEICSVAISEGEQLLTLQESDDPFSHSKIITLLIEKCVKETKINLRDLDAVAVSQGPGSYTALRVGASAAKGICYALNKPLIAVDTLQSIALATYEKEKTEALYCPMIDARRMEVYCKMFDVGNKAVTKLESKVIDESSYNNYFASNQKIIFSGNGAEKCMAVLKSPLAVFSRVYCSAANLISLSQESYKEQKFTDPAYFIPNYHKSPNITTPKKRVL